jgi:hypothetical protein
MGIVYSDSVIKFRSDPCRNDRPGDDDSFIAVRSNRLISRNNSAGINTRGFFSIHDLHIFGCCCVMQLNVPAKQNLARIHSHDLALGHQVLQSSQRKIIIAISKDRHYRPPITKHKIDIRSRQAVTLPARKGPLDWLKPPRFPPGDIFRRWQRDLVHFQTPASASSAEHKYHNFPVKSRIADLSGHLSRPGLLTRADETANVIHVSAGFIVENSTFNQIKLSTLRLSASNPSISD